jgi:hypothetical protein
MNIRIEKAELRVAKAKEKLQEIIRDVQSKCKHPSDFVYEIPFEPETEFFYSQKPFRVCGKCGLAEIGWGIGWKTLPDTHLSIDRKKGEKIVRYMISEEEKCAKKFGKDKVLA